MKTNMKLALIGACLAAMALLALGCAGPSPSERTGIDLPSGRLTYEPNVLSVVLDENTTTGYAWTCEVDGSAVKPSLDEPLSAEDLGKQDGESLAGAPAAHLFEFAPEGTGEATITLSYARSWEDVAPEKTVIVKATVEDGTFKNVEAEER